MLTIKYIEHKNIDKNAVVCFIVCGKDIYLQSEI